MGTLCIVEEDKEDPKIQVLQTKVQQQINEKEDFERLISEASNADIEQHPRIKQLKKEKKKEFKEMKTEEKKVKKLESELAAYRRKIDRAKSQRDRTPSESGSSVSKSPLMSTMAGIVVPKFDLPKERQPIMKSRNSKKQQLRAPESPELDGYLTSDIDDDVSTSSDEEFSTSQSRQTVTATLTLDAEHEPDTDAAKVNSWLFQNESGKKKKTNKDMRLLKKRLADLLTERSEVYRQDMARSYKEQFKRSMESDIKRILEHGTVMHIVHMLMTTRAQYDAELIQVPIENHNIAPVADIICCRTVQQLRELQKEYKSKYTYDLKKILQALAKQNNKNTLIKVISRILDPQREESAEVDNKQIQEDLEFVINTKKFENDAKLRLMLIFLTNSVEYIRVFNVEFTAKTKIGLLTFIEKNLSTRGGSGHFCRLRILYALDTPEYYAQLLKDLLKKWGKNKREIAEIFVYRLEHDLAQIQRQWMINKHGDGKELKEVVLNKAGKKKKSGYTMVKMLENSYRIEKAGMETLRHKGGGQNKVMRMHTGHYSG